ncbi:MAG: NADH-ubiquinone oxidoreductase-F iron-sulfur binding region domain-containing protein [Thermodesulfobacteriota bacterium]|nr:NADH-ubiquinone oxidoreductase-F iron-sulfur binding region domain-containing protein [Thermodesulfobacteriota bacterium]
MNLEGIMQSAKEEWEALQQSDKPLICIGSATCGRSAGALGVLEAFHTELQDKGISANVIEVGCLGPCYAEPLVYIVKPGRSGICYRNIMDDKVAQLIEGYLVNDDPMPEHALGTIGDGAIDGIPSLFDTPVFKPQERRVFKNCGFTDPTNINHYLANDGYTGLAKALEMTPDQIIEELKTSGLRGRGGGGFPAGRKWEAGRNAPGEQKYVVCNADEGDPGAFMDRSLIEGDPHALLEGMIIAGYTIGSDKGYIYVRAEYPLAIKRLQIAIAQANEKGFLGTNILGTGFDFDLEIFQGAGAFVCGESTALTLSIEGKRGMPKAAPRPQTTEKGIFDKPTLLNNVKTFASVPLIITRGGDWFASVGTEKSKGTAVFALTGKVQNCGLIEVPMGITLREIVYDVGGGIPLDKKFKAVQTGGPSGGCLPASLLDTPVDYDSLNAAGAIMGSGGMVVMDEETCMVDVARYFLDFTQKESCGQCVPCSLGTKQMLDILEDITQGKGRPTDVDLLVEIAEAVKDGSLCGLGKSAPNPVLTTIRYFKEEYEAHINEKNCPAKVCKALISYKILEDKCKGCGICVKSCPVDAITGEKKQVHFIDQSTCIRCGMCLEKCPTKFSAVECIPGHLNNGGE